MNEKIIYFYALDTLADWEPGYALAELNTGRYFKPGAPVCRVQTCALTKEPVTTMGGVQLLPDLTVAEITPENGALLLLPGADTWQEPKHAPVLQKAKKFLQAGVPVAAICGATLALACAGVLDDRAHTSNDLDFLKAVCPAYQGEMHYRREPAVTDGNLITASGLAPLEFAYHIFKKLDLFSDETLEAWYKLHQTREPQYFFKLMQSLPAKG